MSSSLQSQLGVIAEASGYGLGPGPVNHFLQYMKADLKLQQYDADGEGLRSSGYVELQSQARTAPQGGEIDFELEWMTKTCGVLLLPMLGSVSTSGPGDSAYTHTASVSGQSGRSQVWQVNVPFFPSGTDQPFTAVGVTIPSWELTAEVDQKVMLKGKADVQSFSKSTSLASASYATNMVPYVWNDVSITVSGVSTKVKSFSLKCDQGANVDRYKLQGSALKQEPTGKKRPKFTVEITPDFEDITMWDRVRATLAQSKFSAMVVTMAPADTGLLIGASSLPTTVITLTSVKWMNIDGLGKSPTDGDVVQKVTGEVRWDGSFSPVIIAYKTADSTP